jgi:hypothetical protein
LHSAQIVADKISDFIEIVGEKIEEKVEEVVEVAEPEPEPVIEQPAPIPINNRVNVICSIGNPNKRLLTIPDPLKTPEPPKSPDVIVIEPPKTIEIQLPPKKKATRPKYNPILHYRKMLLLHDHDEEEER